MLFLAFLFMLNPYTLQKAEAAPSLPAEGTTLTVETVAGKRQVTVPLTITPVTSFPGGGTVEFVFKFRRSGTVIQTTPAQTKDFVYANQIVAGLVYELPHGFGLDGVKMGPVGSVDVGVDTVTVVVYLDEIARPPEGGGGGGGGGALLPGGTTGTDTGWQTYDPSEDRSTVYVDPEKTQSMFAAAPPSGVVLIDVQPVAETGEAPKSVTANLPLDVLNQAGHAQVDSVLQLGSLEVEVLPAVMQALSEAVKKAGGPLANLEIRSVTSDETATTETLAGLGEDTMELMTPASRVMTLSFYAVAPNGAATQLSLSELLLSVPFDVTKVDSAENVNLYRIGSLIFVGGKVEDGKVTARLTSTIGGKFVALEYSRTFADVSGHWAQRDVELMASKYVVEGMTDTTFEPERAITRAEFVTLLTRSLGISEEKPSSPTFSDVASDAWYYGYVEAAFKAGLAGGDSGAGGTFRPQSTITREEMAALMVRAMNCAGHAAGSLTSEEVAALLGAFADEAQVTNWARLEAAQAISEGIINGRDHAMFAPKGNGSRAEAATMMSRFMRQAGIL